ncbi:MAG: transcription termination/antitermination protein NusG [Syntrophobacteraceae bacterium]
MESICNNSPKVPHSSILKLGPVLFPKLTGSEPSWFALYVQVNHEKELTRRLEQKSFECFLPLVESWSKRVDRRKKIHLPLFPGYVFVNTVLDNYANVNILKTPGALTILRNSEGPLPIPNYQIDNLKSLLSSSEPFLTHTYLKEGDYVRVNRGPMAGCIGILLRSNPKKGRLVVSVDIIQRSVSVELNVEDVEPIDTGTAKAISL